MAVSSFYHKIVIARHFRLRKLLSCSGGHNKVSIIADEQIDWING